MKYIECPEVQNSQYCMSNWCNCPSSEIKKGEGYIYISPEVVSFRKNACTLFAFQKKLDKRANHSRNFTKIEYEPILICKKAAELYNLDLSISSDDAKMWWAKQKVPLRATPKIHEYRKNRKFRFFTIINQHKKLYNNIINYNTNHSEPLSINKKFRLSKKQMNILSSTDFTSQVTGLHLEEMANNIIDEKNIRTYGGDFFMKSNSTPKYIIRCLSNSPRRDLKSLKYTLSLIKWLLPILFGIWLCGSMGMFF